MIQIDSERHHSALIDRRADGKQTAALRAAGFEVLRFTDAELWYEDARVVDRLRKARTCHPNRRSAA